jgi:hypothetical protein
MTQGIRVSDLVHHGHVQVPQSLVLPETEVPVYCAVPYFTEREHNKGIRVNEPITPRSLTGTLV